MPENSKNFYSWEPVIQAKTVSDEQKLYLDIVRDSELIFLNGVSLQTLLKGKEIVTETPASQFLSTVETILKDTVLGHISEPESRDKLARELIGHLSQSGVGYLASNAIQGQLGANSVYPAGNSEKHGFKINTLPDGKLSVLSTSIVTNAKLLDGVEIVSMLPETNTKPITQAYVQTTLTLNASGKIDSGEPIAVLESDNIIIKNILFRTTIQDMGSTNTTSKKLISNELNAETSALINQVNQMRQVEQQVNSLTGILTSYQTHLNSYNVTGDSPQSPLLEKKKQIVSNLLTVLASKDLDANEKLKKAYTGILDNKSTLEQHQSSQEGSIWQKIKSFFINTFVQSEGAKTIKKLESTDSFKNYKVAYNAIAKPVASPAPVIDEPNDEVSPSPK